MKKTDGFVRSRMNTLAGRPHDLKSVFIETHRDCQNECYMCPSRKTEKKYGRLTDKSFTKVIDELSAHDYTGELHMYGQNEPLVDEKIFQRIEYARKKLPYANIILISNFIALDDGKIDQLVSAPLSRVTASLYAFDRASYLKICQRDHFETVMVNLIKFSRKWAETQPYTFTVDLIRSPYNEQDHEFIRFFSDQIPCTNALRPTLWNLGGALKTQSRKFYFDPWIFSLVKINATGDMSLCAVDVNCRLYIGNITTDSLMDAFEGQKAQSKRNDLFYRKKSLAGDFCDHCTFATRSKISYFISPSPFRLMSKTCSLFRMKPPKVAERFESQNETFSPAEIQEKMERFKKLFSGDSGTWCQLISEIRHHFHTEKQPTPESSDQGRGSTG